MLASATLSVAGSYVLYPHPLPTASLIYHDYPFLHLEVLAPKPRLSFTYTDDNS